MSLSLPDAVWPPDKVVGDVTRIMADHTPGACCYARRRSGRVCGRGFITLVNLWVDDSGLTVVAAVSIRSRCALLITHLIAISSWGKAHILEKKVLLASKKKILFHDNFWRCRLGPHFAQSCHALHLLKLSITLVENEDSGHRSKTIHNVFI